LLAILAIKRKDTQEIEQFLSKNQMFLKRILSQAKRPLKDAAAVNSTRWALFNRLRMTGLPVSTGSGGQKVQSHSFTTT
jgi:hypothetical protein